MIEQERERERERAGWIESESKVMNKGRIE